MAEFDIFELQNGIRVVHRAVQRPVGHLSFHFALGSRDEMPEEQGLAHFLEHCIFKGTEKRRAYHILSRMEDAGGELNAYTGKEEMVIYTSFLEGDYPRAVELLTDVAFRSVFPVKEVEKEKEVVIDEINSYRDTPSESIFDEFEEQLFQGNPLGRNILGTYQSVRSFTRADILRFMKRNMGSNRIVISSVGPVSSARLKQILHRELGQWPLPEAPRTLTTPAALPPEHRSEKRPIFQTHAILGSTAYAATNERNRVLMLLNNLLGGPGMNSRLNLNIREKYGFTYYLESFYQPYQDTGLFGIYLGTDPGTVQRSFKLIEKELQKLRTKPLGVLQLQKAKRQLLGQMAMAQENNAALGHAYGKSLLMFNRIDEFETIRAKIEAISSAQLQEVAQDLLHPEKMSSTIYHAQSAEPAR